MGTEVRRQLSTSQSGEDRRSGNCYWAEGRGMNVSLDFLSQLPRLLREMIAIMQEPMDKRRELRHQFFDSEISPAHEAMLAINADYMASFSELLARMVSKDDLASTIELLKKKRLVLLI